MDPDATLPTPGAPVDPEALVAGPERAARRLVLLHGWGADADDLLDLGQELVDATVSVVALRAPQAHPGGFGRQWYPLSPAPEWVQLLTLSRTAPHLYRMQQRPQRLRVLKLHLRAQVERTHIHFMQNCKK